MTVVGYDFKGYIDDDAESLHRILTENWSKGDLKDRSIFFYDESVDPSTFDFKQGECAIRIYADDIISEPRGISFDSESSSRIMRIDLRTINREDSMLIADQIRYILAHYRLRPWRDWQTMYFSAYTPVYPSFKFYHSVITITLRKYCVMLPNVDLNGNYRYSGDTREGH